ncbi:LacI family DNA-binding transcriptional regulator [Wukongibacter baidiensis]|uniref:LacI family DNA-binding transcriptional regulator n=1 Tax=Wukongibacter baidiensis TaxID=1723361 RepID=UPI003D7FAD20
MKITIKEIAKMAGVSTATVSKILNKKDKNISDATRQRVLDIVKEHNYIPNTIARSLVTRQTKTIGLVIPDIANPFFPELARGAEDKANESGYNIIFCNTDDNIEKEEKYINMLVEKMIDGIIFTQSAKRTMGFGNLNLGSTPIVLIDRDMELEGVVGKVLVDNFTGAYEGVKYLINEGYKKIAFITGALTTDTSVSRLNGYKEALEDSGILYDDDYVLAGEYRSEWGFKATEQLIDRKIDFDAVFCGNDLIALSVIKALKNYGKSIPEDVGVLGFDDIYMSKFIEPELSTIRQPNYKMGYKAVEILINILENPAEKNIEKKLILNTELIIRKST